EAILTLTSFAHQRLHVDAKESDQAVFDYRLDRDSNGKRSLFRRVKSQIDGPLTAAVGLLVDLRLHTAKERPLPVGIAIEAVVEHRLVGLFGVDVQPLVGERGQREDGLATAVLEG